MKHKISSKWNLIWYLQFPCFCMEHNQVKLFNLLHLLSLVSFFFHHTVPAGKPTITTAHNTSSSSIYLSWKPPPLDTIYGEFLGYRITYHARDVKPENINEIFVRDSSVEVSITAVFLLL